MYYSDEKLYPDQNSFLRNKNLFLHFEVETITTDKEKKSPNK